MDPLNIVVVFHPQCKPSTDFLISVNKLQDVNLEYINIKEDKIETSINIDVVPLIIINNDPSKIFKGRAAFDKIEELIKKPPINNAKKDTGGIKYGKRVSFIEDDGKKEKIDLSKR